VAFPVALSAITLLSEEASVVGGVVQIPARL